MTSWIRERLPEGYPSRGGAGVLALIINAAFLCLLVGWWSHPATQQPDVEPILALMVDQPRGSHSESQMEAIQPHLFEPHRVPDTPPNVRVDVPFEAPPMPEPSDIPAATAPGIKEQPGEGAPPGATDELGSGSGEGIAVLHYVSAVYSQSSFAAHERGVVALRVLVDGQGKPAQVRLLHSSGFARLDASATDAVAQYRFTPPVRGSQAAQAWTTVTLEFDPLPMPVPTMIVKFDPVIAEQIASARSLFSVHTRQTEDVLNRLAAGLFDKLSNEPSARPDPRHPRAPATPIQQLALRGKLKSVRFKGVASAGFDCGNRDSARNRFDSLGCEIFEVRQTGGTSYWLASMDNNGTVLKSIAITMADAPQGPNALQGPNAPEGPNASQGPDAPHGPNAPR
jgi:TonB family protein